LLALQLNPPGRKLGAAVAKLTRDSAGSPVYDAQRVVLIAATEIRFRVIELRQSRLPST